MLSSLSAAAERELQNQGTKAEDKFQKINNELLHIFFEASINRVILRRGRKPTVLRFPFPNWQILLLRGESE